VIGWAASLCLRLVPHPYVSLARLLSWWFHVVEVLFFTVSCIPAAERVLASSPGPISSWMLQHERRLGFGFTCAIPLTMLGSERDLFATALQLDSPPLIDLSAEEAPALLYGLISSCGFDLSSERTPALPHDLRNPAPLSIAFAPLIGLLNKKSPALPCGPILL
jgi:hypothetical protein